MAIEKWNPLGDLIALQDRMNNLLKDALGAANVVNDRSNLAWNPPMDFFEIDDAYLVVAELPGLKKSDIDIKIEDNNLVVTVANPAPAEKTVSKRNFYRRERSYGTCKRSFNLPSSVKTGEIDASFKQGVLEVRLPKAGRSTSKSVTVNIHG
jgi:HSP20 family protein